MRVRITVPEGRVGPDVLEPALEAVTRVNEADVRARAVPTFRAALARGIRWRPEPPGDEHFDSARTVLGRKWGDCDDLAPWHAASLRATGQDPGARVVVRRSGPGRWHAVVRRSDGSIEDPSVAAGMRAVVGADYRPPVTRAVLGASSAPAADSRRAPWGAWLARVEVPWGDRYGVALHRVAGTPVVVGVHALTDAARLCGVLGRASWRDRCLAARDLLCGVDPYAVTQRRGVDGFSLADLTRPFQKAASAVVQPVMQAARSVPGVAPALEALAPLLQQASPLVQAFGPALGPWGAASSPLIAAVLRAYGQGA